MVILLDETVDDLKNAKNLKSSLCVYVRKTTVSDKTADMKI